MKILIDIPKAFEVDYNTDRFAEFFHRCLADMDTCCGNYEQETAEMMEKAFEKKFEEVDAMTEAVKYQADEIYKLKEIQKMTLNKTAIVKYDAFKDVGGKLSFALAMLDKENSGFVLNAIHSREGCYTYVKEIVKGESYIVLGEEEKEALRQAVNAHNDIG